MGDSLYGNDNGPKLDHPDSTIRLASIVHRFKVPCMKRKVNFTKSFDSTGRAPPTRRLMQQADDSRVLLDDGMQAQKTSAKKIVADAHRYQPLVNTVLLSCKVQPEEARLDERLVFAWTSGIEKDPKTFSSEAIMYDLVMSIATEGLGHAVSATEQSVAGEFAVASRDYASAAGIFDFLAEELLPQWISKGSKVDDDSLPSECHAAMAAALKLLFMANGQQMAIATVLMKPGTPNYSLLAKLCLGVADQLEEFVAKVRRDAFEKMARMDKDFFTLVSFQIGVQKSLSLYFQGRAFWEKKGADYGTAIALLSEATVALRTRESTASAGVPDVSRTPALKPLQDDLKDFRTHMQVLLRAWESDNSSVFFESVPQKVPESKKLQEGLCMKKATKFALDEVEPVLLKLPQGALERSDSDLAREMQERLNSGLND